MMAKLIVSRICLALMVWAFTFVTASSQQPTPPEIGAIEDAISRRDIPHADFLIARYLGASFKKGETLKSHNRLLPFFKRHPGWAPTHFISGKYSNEFIDFFSRGSWSIWGDASRSNNPRHSKILIEEGTYGNKTVVIWGTPTYRNLYVLTDPGPRLLTVIGSEDTRIVFEQKNKGGSWDYCKRNTMNREGTIQYIWEPEFIDLDSDGRRELLIRYNVMMADGYRQILDIYDISSFCQPELLRTFIGIHGIATHHHNSIVVSNETSLDGKSILSQDRQKFRSFRLKKGKFIKISETLEDNFLWKSDWMKRVKAVAEKMKRKDL